MKKICRCIIPLLLMLLMLPRIVYAAGSIDPTRDVRMNLSYQNGSTSLAGAEFRIYLVATVDKTGALTVTETFKQFNVDIRGKNDAAWKDLASTLEGYVLRDKITATDSGKTDASGNLTFPTGSQKLTKGLYLVLGQRHTQGSYRYDASPFMVMLPSQDSEKNEWLYDVSVNPKHDSAKIPDGSSSTGTYITRKVLKVWNDAGNESLRPQKIVVQLLRDEEIYKTVTLSAANNWRYTWTGLNDSYVWTIVEKESENYTVSVAQEGVTFVITNTYSSSGSGGSDDSEIQQVGDPLLLGRTRGAVRSPQTRKLPQTGSLWWPVPVLVCGGVVFLIVGTLSRKKKDHE